jgi:cytoskeletal protein CcmA (bactofilin family)
MARMGLSLVGVGLCHPGTNRRWRQPASWARGPEDDAPPSQTAHIWAKLPPNVPAIRAVGQRKRGSSVAENGVLIVTEDTVIRGVRELRNCRQLEVFGYLEGEVAAKSVLVHKNGRLFGKVKSDTAEIHGTLQGEVVVKNLIDIRSSGNVSGNIQYGKLALEQGGNLSAEVRNVPPALAGDLNLEVSKGGTVPVTLQDLNALDPDDNAKDLKFTVSNARSGYVALSTAPRRSVSAFTQVDLEAGRVAFVHDGRSTGPASFDIVVADRSGGTSGKPQTVKVTVRG